MKIAESELATHFINTYLKDFEVYKEVPCGGIIDIIAVNGAIITSIEAKTTFSFDVIEQAIKNKSYAHYSYVLIPQTKSKSFAYEICKNYGIGVITVLCNERGMHMPIERVRPVLNRKIYKPKLSDWQKNNIAGVQSGRITPFSNTVNEIQLYLKRQREQKALVKETLNRVNHHYGSFSSATKCLMNMCNQGVIKQFYFDKGYICLNKTNP